MDQVSAERIDYLLIGGGLASAKCARTLREQGAEGRILIVGRESDPPYNRPNCSKGFLRGVEQRQEAYVDPPEFWEEFDVQLRTRTSVTALDPRSRTAALSSRDELSFGSALIATGANVRRLNVEGCNLDGIHYLRTLGNAEAIREAAAEAEHIVLIGGSYIACEVAASLSMMGRQATIVMQEAVTLERGFGAEAGRFFEELLRSHGVTIHGEDGLSRFEGDGGVRVVVTDRGLHLPAELVVIGAGVSPDVQLAKSAGLRLGESGGVMCDAMLRTSAEGIFAAGDVCEYDSVLHGRRLRVEHWDVAFNHGETAALNMLGREVAHEVVPYFFSVLGDWAELEYVGPASSFDEEILRGDRDGASFTRWYLDQGVLRAALTVGRSEDLDVARSLIASKAKLDATQKAALGDLSSDLKSIWP